MITGDVAVWTKRGWLRSADLLVGDVTISYNPARNCTEYDKVYSITQDYGTTQLLGLKAKSANILVTKDHPIIVYRKAENKSERKKMDDVFLSYMEVGTSVLYNRWFEPYHITKDLDDVAWSARVAASFANVRYMPIECREAVWGIVNEIHGIEAQHWVDVFFHWNVLQRGVNWMKTIRLRNRDVRDIVFYIAPRAGLGAKFMPPPIRKPGNPWLMSVSDTSDLRVSPLLNWYQDRKTGFTFNIATRNGSFLAKKHSGTFISACDLA